MAQKQDYRNLSKFEKFENIKDTHVSFCERKAYAEYLRAIWLNDLKTISFFESFGDHPRKII